MNFFGIHVELDEEKLRFKILKSEKISKNYQIKLGVKIFELILVENYLNLIKKLKNLNFLNK